MRIPEFIARQGRCPSGWLGGLVHRIMALETAGENAKAIELAELQPGDHVLEIGYGHGRTLPKVAAHVPEGFVAGIDPSEKALGMATRHNRALIADRKLEVKCASSDRIPFPDGRFDKAISAHALYFWARPVDDLREIRRVLKPGGRFVLAFRSKDDEEVRKAAPPSTHTLYTAAEVQRLLAAAGFVGVRVVDHRFSARRRAYFALAHNPS